MSDDDVQNYGNHRRWKRRGISSSSRFLLNALLALAALLRAPSREAAWVAIVATAVVGAAALLRRMALTVQNRVIRLERSSGCTVPPRAA